MKFTNDTTKAAVRDYIKQSVDKKRIDKSWLVYESAHAEKEARKEYMNEYQLMLFDFMNSLPLTDNLKDELHKVVLAAQVQNAPDFIKAKNVLFKIAMDIKEGTLTVASTLRAVFVGAFNKVVGRSKVNPD